MDDRGRVPGDDQTIVGALPERCDGAFDLARIPHVDRAQLDAKRWRRALECAELDWPGSYRRFSKDRHTCYGARRALWDHGGVATTAQLLDWAYPRPGRDRRERKARATAVAYAARQMATVIGRVWPGGNVWRMREDLWRAGGCAMARPIGAISVAIRQRESVGIRRRGLRLGAA